MNIFRATNIPHTFETDHIVWVQATYKEFTELRSFGQHNKFIFTTFLKRVLTDEDFKLLELLNSFYAQFTKSPATNQTIARETRQAIYTINNLKRPPFKFIEYIDVEDNKPKACIGITIECIKRFQTLMRNDALIIKNRLRDRFNIPDSSVFVWFWGELFKVANNPPVNYSSQRGFYIWMSNVARLAANFISKARDVQSFRCKVNSIIGELAVSRRLSPDKVANIFQRHYHLAI